MKLQYWPNRLTTNVAMGKWIHLLQFSFFLVYHSVLCTTRPNERAVVQRIRTDEPSIERYAYFDTELFETLARQKKEQNVAVSPISVKLVLGMLMEGAKGSSEEQIRRALRLPEDKPLRRKIFRSWVQPFLEQNQTTQLEFATQLFLAEDTSAQPDYSKIIQKWFGGNITNIDFSNAHEAAKEINDWVDIKTNGVITDLVSEDQLSSSTNAILASAVYFKGIWAKPFDKKATTNRCFEREPIKTTDDCYMTSYMRIADSFKYAYISTLNAQVVELPYKDNRFSMIVVLPKGRVEELERDMVHEQVHRLLSQMKYEEMDVQIPRFTINFRDDLSAALQRLRITDVFGEEADLSGIIIQSEKQNLTIGSVFHSVRVEVDEKGTVAAAATGAAIVPLIGEQRISFVADKPFIFCIRDAKTRSILFAGRVYTPDAAVMNIDKKGGEVIGVLDKNFPPLYNVVPTERPYQNQKPGPPSRIQRHPPRKGAESRPYQSTVRPQYINENEDFRPYEGQPASFVGYSAPWQPLPNSNSNTYAKPQKEKPQATYFSYAESVQSENRPTNNNFNNNIGVGWSTPRTSTTQKKLPMTTPPPMTRKKPMPKIARDASVPFRALMWSAYS